MTKEHKLNLELIKTMTHEELIEFLFLFLGYLNISFPEKPEGLEQYLIKEK